MRVSRPVLRGPAGAIPVGYSPHSLGGAWRVGGNQ